ncbi:phage shock protein PspC (stress-responsive transcriptional regulator) [Pedobacter cryoconitis]|uniref:Phage shock protein PspC (Stress-responsive transcriptional regulator) n=1 Tax=Pedobacter cryoconitis TaxID=188932 RepID=A0A7W9E0L5_9SPHI|nr:PspC domain-containing protein [Pedobacter cryoconitis]MBB5638587.1 phage shock protein PspC (stress-responsive transcriptional regulator) [Pedobacter cryoconitis]
MENRLLRNEHDKIIAGVSSGLAEYMQVDVTIIRLLFVLSTIFLVGTGVLVYLVMWIVVPVNNDPAARFSKFNDYFKKQNDFHGFNTPPPFGQQNTNAPENPDVKSNAATDWNNPVDFKSLPKNNDTGRTIGGLFLLVIGLYFLMNEFNIIPYWFRLGKLWPLVFVAIGLSFILKAKRKDKWEDWKSQQAEDVNTAQKPVSEEPAKPSSDQAAENQL